MNTASEVLDNVGGAMMIGGCLVFRPLVQPWYSRWHATATEAAQTLPGDERVPQPLVQQTLAVTIQARAADVWPWVA
ncbi:MAG: hypothetical protein IPK16_16445 [Anaerolineales bacterium]|nr:hypothetical protein [Anaerolineales bacterium]